MKTSILIVLTLAICSCATAQKGTRMFTGIAAAMVTHEAGHEIAAIATDTPISWDSSILYNIDPSSKQDGAVVCAAGLITQQLSSEIIIRGKYKNDYTEGMMLWNTINPILYSLDYWVDFGYGANRFGSDIRALDRYSNSDTANLFSAAMIGLSVFNAYRYWWKDAEPINIGVVPTLGGAGIFYSHNF